ncbi:MULTISPECIES: dipicolinate synthase subunit DpsA [unclassified Ruminococcus]|uniref:dipicolinate synthase subunit DpsA n=1 Tax=unclassified Ruminococcus TaxID=2608920 RepID=UPI00210CBACE|nr:MULTISPECIES: dipicolinate synthase subunit DpsA [unclassified Ruminococcus]MCQ4021816.1 dipicolinate synthase subunit DpsA [Ruminococcus sp. zg-924]MCQ4114261.1 dipicolinate synthase subunit DpsA [Ruminococcus sp. zg-921]
MKIRSFSIIGGDKRQLYCAQAMQSEGYKVYISGFDRLENEWSLEHLPIDKTLQLSDCAVLPMPLTKDGKTLNAPFALNDIPLDDSLARRLKGKRVFCTMSGRLKSLSPVWEDVYLCDYLSREELAVENAVPTAEGAIEVAMREYPGTIHGSKCLVAGFGRIGKVLCKMLLGLGATVYAAARKKSDLSLINALGYNTVNTTCLCSYGGFDIVFNTVPAMIFTAHTLAKTCKQALVIDLASLPGGVDFDSAKRLGIKAVHALSLPGKVAPKASGEIIKNTIFNMLEED